MHWLAVVQEYFILDFRRFLYMCIFSGGVCSGYLGDGPSDRLAQNATSFGVDDVTMMNDVSRCDVPAERVICGGQYRRSPATGQVNNEACGLLCVAVRRS